MRSRHFLAIALAFALTGTLADSAYAGGPATFQSSLGPGVVGQGDIIETFSMWCGDAYCNAGGAENLWAVGPHATLSAPSNMCTPSRMRLQIGGGPPAEPMANNIDLTTGVVRPGETIALELPDVVVGGNDFVSLAALDTTSTEGCAGNPGGSFTVTVRLKAAHPFAFSAVGPAGSLSDLAVGDPISYQGSRWQHTGPAVTVSLDGRKIGTGSPDSFAGGFKLPDWPKRGCESTLVANQRGIKSTLVLRGKALARVDAGSTRLHKRTLTPGSKVCAGERAADLRSAHVILVTTQPSLGIAPSTVAPGSSPAGTDEAAFNFRGLAIYDTADHVQINGGVFARSVKVGSLRSSGGFPDPHLLDPAGEGGATALGPTLSLPGLSGVNRRAGDLTAEKGLSLDNALIYVAGNLVVRGPITGSGAIVVTGSATVHGTVDLSADLAGLAFETGGTLRFTH